MSDVRSCITNVSVHLPHDANMLVAVEERVLLVPDHATSTAVGSFVGLETCIGEHNNQPLSIFVVGSNGSMLLCNELRQFWWGA